MKNIQMETESVWYWIKINIDGGDLSFDVRLLLIKEVAAKIGFSKLIKKKFIINDKLVHFHKDDENLL